MLRVPLNEAGLIDHVALAKRPAMATVRRFWPNEPDQTGHLIRSGRAWVFSYAIGEDDDEKVYHLDDRPMRVGDYVTLTEPDGSQCPFRVVRSHVDGVTSA